MAFPDWLITNHNTSRTRPISYLTPPQDEIVSDDSDAVWNSWDMELMPGKYKLERLSTSALFLDHFVVGTIPYPTQPEPIQIKDRLGELYAHSVTDMSQEAGIVPGRFYRSIDKHFIEFNVSAGVIFRIESFASGLPNVFPPPPQALPNGFTEWIIFHFVQQRYDGIGDPVAGPSGWLRDTATNFGNTLATVSKRSLGRDGQSYIYSAEDGVDTDFNDLVAELTILEYH